MNKSMATDILNRGRRDKVFTNWAKIYSCQPELYFEPRTEDEIKQILLSATAKNKKVKVAGSGHSPSDLACTDDYMISLNKFDKVLKVDKDSCQVTVQGGCTVEYLNEVLPEHGLAIAVQGSVSDITLAGAISTGTHGTGFNYSIISSYVVKLELMTAAGDKLVISEDENSDLFQSAVLSLGCLGVILTITLQCEKAFQLHQIQSPNKLKDVIENLDIYGQSSDHFRFLWYPHTDSVLCFHASRSQEKTIDKSSWFWDKFVGYYILEMLLYISTFIPSLVQYISRLYFNLNSKKVEQVDRSDRVFNFDCLFNQYVMEWALPRERTGVVIMELKQWFETTLFPAHFPIEVRFVKKDDIYLSPAYQQDTCYINIIMYKPYNKDVEIEDYWKAFQDIMVKNSGRPHWAKDFTYTSEEFSRIYPKWSEFVAIRQRLDPHGTFLNNNLKRIFKI